MAKKFTREVKKILRRRSSAWFLKLPAKKRDLVFKVSVQDRRGKKQKRKGKERHGSTETHIVDGKEARRLEQQAS
jgi:hypothetical protein